MDVLAEVSTLVRLTARQTKVIVLVLALAIPVTGGTAGSGGGGGGGISPRWRGSRSNPGAILRGIPPPGISAPSAALKAAAEVICSIQMPTSTPGFCADNFFLMLSSERMRERRISARKSPQ